MSAVDHGARFGELFQGRLDAFGTDEGGCERPREDWTTYADYLTRVDAHLRGTKPMGVYPVRADNTCRWLCIDWDTQDALQHAEVAHLAFNMLGITSWVERSRSKGFHLWVFFSEDVHSATARRAGLAACQISGASAKEVNPKQDVLVEGMLGNYVRTPYPGGCGIRQVVVDGSNTAMDVHTFVERALAGRATAKQIADVAALYIEPPKPVAPRPDPRALEGDAVKRMGGLAFTVWQDGPLEGGDRSDALFKLVCLLREGGKHTSSEAFALLQDADERWGKWNGSGAQLEKLFARAWGA
jgi:hypothetical protein